MLSNFILILHLSHAQQSEVSVECDEGIVSEPILLDYGSHTVNCKISPATDLDGFSFEGNNGDNIRITVLSASSCFDPRVELRAPDGTVLQDTFCNGEPFSNFPFPCSQCSLPTEDCLPLSGTYLLAISEQGSNETGGYQVNLQSLFGNYSIEPPSVSIFPTSFDFGGVNIGTSSAPQLFTISNVGDENLIMDSISISPSPSMFGILNDTCSGQNLPPGESCTLSIIFAPSALNTITAAFTIPSNDPMSRLLDVPISGMATSCPPVGDINRDYDITPADALCIFKVFLKLPSCLDSVIIQINS